MDIEFLREYEAKEREEINRFRDHLRQGKLPIYPPKGRLKLHEPYTTAFSMKKIWPIIPLYGTTIIQLAPTLPENFQKVHGFCIEDIKRLINFAKDTKGRIQFVLTDMPTTYSNLDFIEPILLELNPPVLPEIRPYDFDVIRSKEWAKEILVWLDEEMVHWLADDYSNIFSFTKYSWGDVLGMYALPYTWLKFLGYEQICDEVMLQLTLKNPKKAFNILLAARFFIVSCYTCPLEKRIVSMPKDFKIKSKKMLNINGVLNNIELSYEVGKFLSERLKLIAPVNIDGAIELNDRFEFAEIRKVLNALNTAIKRYDVDQTKELSLEIRDMFENVWGESEIIRRKVTIARYGISLGIGVIGTIATLPIGGFGGLLAGLGFLVGDKIADIRLYEGLSENVVKRTSASHMVHIYDFKKKYKV